MIKQYKSMAKKFTKVDNFSPFPESFHGVHSLPELLTAEKKQKQLLIYKRAGLCEAEIELYTGNQIPNVSANSRFGENPSIKEEKLKDIELKLKSFYDAQPGLKEDQEEYNLLPTADRKGFSKDPFDNVRELAKIIEARKTNFKKRNIKEDSGSSVKKKSEDKKFVPDLTNCAYHVSVPLTLNEIKDNRLSVEEIKKLPRFQNYQPGTPNNVLYLKNLHPKVDLRELISLFGNLNASESFPEIRLLTGKMKGQAFVTFKDPVIALAAFNVVNGYKMRNRPIIIEFGRKKTE